MEKIEELAVTAGPPVSPCASFKVFSSPSFLVKPRVLLSGSGPHAAVAGRSGSLCVFDREGRALATRRHSGRLLALQAERDGTIRVLASRSVLRFAPEREGSYSEWAGGPELLHAATTPGGTAFGLLETGRVIGFRAEAGEAIRLFTLPPEGVTAMGAGAESIAFVRREGTVEVFTPRGDLLRRIEDEEPPSRLLAASSTGFLVACGRQAVLLGRDGREVARRTFDTEIARGVTTRDGFLALGDSGVVVLIGSEGSVKTLFRARIRHLVSVPGPLDDPVFLLAADSLLTAVTRNGSVRWWFSAPEKLLSLAASPDGRYAAALAGCELFLLCLAGEPVASGSGFRPGTWRPAGGS